MGFKDKKKEVEEMMAAEFASPLVKELRENKGMLKRDSMTIFLAEHYGFCWGVERSVCIIIFYLFEIALSEHSNISL